MSESWCGLVYSESSLRYKPAKGEYVLPGWVIRDNERARNALLRMADAADRVVKASRSDDADDAG